VKLLNSRKCANQRQSDAEILELLPGGDLLQMQARCVPSVSQGPTTSLFAAACSDGIAAVGLKAGEKVGAKRLANQDNAGSGEAKDSAGGGVTMGDGVHKKLKDGGIWDLATAEINENKKSKHDGRSDDVLNVEHLSLDFLLRRRGGSNATTTTDGGALKQTHGKDHGGENETRDEPKSKEDGSIANHGGDTHGGATGRDSAACGDAIVPAPPNASRERDLSMESQYTGSVHQPLTPAELLRLPTIKTPVVGDSGADQTARREGSVPGSLFARAGCDTVDSETKRDDMMGAERTASFEKTALRHADSSSDHSSSSTCSSCVDGGGNVSIGNGDGDPGGGAGKSAGPVKQSEQTTAGRTHQNFAEVIDEGFQSRHKRHQEPLQGSSGFFACADVSTDSNTNHHNSSTCMAHASTLVSCSSTIEGGSGENAEKGDTEDKPRSSCASEGRQKVNMDDTRTGTRATTSNVPHVPEAVNLPSIADHANASSHSHSHLHSQEVTEITIVSIQSALQPSDTSVLAVSAADDVGVQDAKERGEIGLVPFCGLQKRHQGEADRREKQDAEDPTSVKVDERVAESQAPAVGQLEDRALHAVTTGRDGMGGGEAESSTAFLSCSPAPGEKSEKEQNAWGSGVEAREAGTPKPNEKVQNIGGSGVEEAREAGTPKPDEKEQNTGGSGVEEAPEAGTPKLDDSDPITDAKAIPADSVVQAGQIAGAGAGVQEIGKVDTAENTSPVGQMEVADDEEDMTDAQAELLLLNHLSHCR
jgi:hypothetical protein